MSLKIIDKESPTQWSEYTIEGHSETKAEIFVRHYEDVTWLTDALKGMEVGNHDSELGRLQASIPMSLYVDLMRKGIFKDQKSIRRWLNDPDNRAFRVSGGKL